MIEAKGITKRYGETLAVDDVSFSVSRGEIVGFLGPNGAGKSTTMKVLTGYLAPTGGTAEIAGYDVVEDSVAARASIGYLPENTPLYEDMGVLDFLAYMARLQGVPGDKVSGRVDELVGLCDIGRMAHKDIGELSKGYRQRVGLAQALLHDPPVLILDEPTSGLDPAQIVEIRALIRRIAEEKAILLSTHILPEAQNTCDRILIINRGRLVGEGTPSQLLDASEGREVYTIGLRGGESSVIEAQLGALPRTAGVEALSANGTQRFRLSAEKGADLNEQIFDLAVARGWKLVELNRISTTLEDVFLRLTSGGALGVGSPEADVASATQGEYGEVNDDSENNDDPDGVPTHEPLTEEDSSV